MRSYTFELRRKFKKTVSENLLRIAGVRFDFKNTSEMYGYLFFGLNFGGEVNPCPMKIAYTGKGLHRLKVTTKFHLR